MNTNQLETLIRERLQLAPGAEDLLTMIRIVAGARGEAHGRKERTVADTIFAAAVSL
jgi:hypothetical protein